MRSEGQARGLAPLTTAERLDSPGATGTARMGFLEGFRGAGPAAAESTRGADVFFSEGESCDEAELAFDRCVATTAPRPRVNRGASRWMTLHDQLRQPRRACAASIAHAAHSRPRAHDTSCSLRAGVAQSCRLSTTLFSTNPSAATGDPTRIPGTKGRCRTARKLIQRRSVKP